jgi:putative restriction endonuclease
LRLAEVVRRRGQAKFRKALLAAYREKCAITGCYAVEALEAALISPYRGDYSDHLQNGLAGQRRLADRIIAALELERYTP